MKIIDNKNRVMTPEDIKEDQELDKLLDQEKLEKFLADLEAAASTATPGPWHANLEGFSKKGPGHAPPTVYACHEDLHYVAKCMDFMPAHEPLNNNENCEYIAKANPDTVKKLVAIIRAQAEALEILEEARSPSFPKEPMNWEESSQIAREAQEKVKKILGGEK